ncbi:MAG: TVP38/TMEM64 family protein [Candidatus Electronema sp. V4]|uniref:TVP38/TMEM64 family protein n=1 Tax=Candidatus Electronema sp. V4 TaxID=3454756 RepID=UPI004055518B
MHNKAKALVALGIAVLAAAFFLSGLHEHLSLTSLRASRAAFQTYYAAHPLPAIAAYMAAYVLLTALSLPGAAVMTLTGGALFGLWPGLPLVSFASSIGATLAFLAARFLLRDCVQDRFGERLAAVNRGIAQDGALYLLTLRLVPVFPFFIINLVMGLTALRPAVFYLVSQIGMLPGALVYVNAGTQLGRLDSLSGVLSPGLLLSFALLGMFPLLAKHAAAMIRRKNASRKAPLL